MAEFYITLSESEIATQIAQLLNLHNRLYRNHTTYTVYGSATRYFVELDGTKVIGCVGLTPKEPELSLVHHLCVDPNYRRRGMGKRLLNTAVVNSATRYIYGTIREDNAASLNLVSQIGFVFVKKDWSRDHNIITVGRARP